jgi:hypothetical protein
VLLVLSPRAPFCSTHSGDPGSSPGAQLVQWGKLGTRPSFL